jgi:hypothetical protein
MYTFPNGSVAILKFPGWKNELWLRYSMTALKEDWWMPVDLLDAIASPTLI